MVKESKNCLLLLWSQDRQQVVVNLHEERDLEGNVRAVM
jgi:hypothetical protein